MPRIDRTVTGRPAHDNVADSNSSSGSSSRHGARSESSQHSSEDAVHAFGGEDAEPRNVNNQKVGSGGGGGGGDNSRVMGRQIAGNAQTGGGVHILPTSRVDGKQTDDSSKRAISSIYDNGRRKEDLPSDNATQLEEGVRTLRNDDNSSNARAGGDRAPGEEGGRGVGGNKHRSGRVTGFLAGLKRVLFRVPDAKSDLNMEMLEELHMVTGFTSKELRLTRLHFLDLVEDPSRITREEFLAIPSVANNPLRERLLVCFGFDTVESLEFKDFVEILSIFNNHGAQRDQKLRMAFTLVDIDGDGQVSKNDLVRYLELITAAPEGVKVDLDAVAERVIEEGVSTPGGVSLSLADYIKIMGAADFDDKLTIPV